MTPNTMTTPRPPNRPVYLDNQATTPLRPARAGGDAALVHRALRQPAQRRARHGHARPKRRWRQARAQVAALIGAEPREVVFTSGATESNNIAIKGAARYAAARRQRPRRRIVTVATEHKCVLESVADLQAEGFEPVFLPVRPDGLLDPDALRDALAVPTLLVSVMAVNNETGVVQDIAGAGGDRQGRRARCSTPTRRRRVGKIPLDVTGWKQSICCRSAATSSTGRRGWARCIVRRRPRVRLAPLFSGGGQERGLRSGTLPAPLIVGLGEACRLAQAEMAEEAVAHRRAARAPAAAAARRACRGCGSTAARWQRASPGNLNLTFPAATAAELMARGAGSVRLHRLGLFLGRDRAVLCAARAGAVRRGGRAHLAHRDRTLYLPRRYRLRGRRAGGGACGDPLSTDSRGLTHRHAENDFHRARRHAPRGRRAARPVGAGDRAQARRRYRGRLRRLARLLDLPRHRRSGLVQQAGASRPRTRRTCSTSRSG